MKYFAERNGFVIPDSMLLTGGISQTVINVISNCFSNLNDELDVEDERAKRSAPWDSYTTSSYYQLCLAIWTRFLNRRSNNYGYRTDDSDAVQRTLLNSGVPWYTKLSMIEFAIEFMDETFTDPERFSIKEDFIDNLNSEFERTNYGYRVINGTITDIISSPEKETIEKALSTDTDSVREHMQHALILYSQRPEPDYKNAIKESISAVEALFRIETGERTFGPAYGIIKNSIQIHPRIQESIQKIYDYTNQADTGIRHSKVVGDGAMEPGAPECQFMLVTCSAIINYIQEKLALIPAK